MREDTTMAKYICFIIILFSSFPSSSQSTVVGEKIKSIEVKVVGDPKRVPFEGDIFRMKYITTLENGTVIEAPLEQKYSDYIIEIEGAKTLKSRQTSNKGNLRDQWACKKCEEGKDNVLTINIKREKDKDWLVSKRIKIVCARTMDEIIAEERSKELIFTGAEIEEIQTEFKKLSQSQLLKIASGFHQLSDTRKKITGMGFKGLNKAKKDAVEKALDEADRKQKIQDVLYWRNAPEVTPIASKSKVYNFKSADSLNFSTGPSKNMAFLKEGNTFIQVKTYSTDYPDKHGFVKQYGFTINVYDISSSGKLVKRLSRNVESNLTEASGISINQFKSCPKGYILVNPDMYIVFDKKFNVHIKRSNSSKLKERLYLDVDQLGTSDKYVVFYGEPSHSGYSENNYFINTEVLDQRTAVKETGSFVEQIIKSDDCIQTPSFTRVFNTSDTEFVVVYFEDQTTRLIKYKYENRKRTLIWKDEYNVQMGAMKRAQNNTLLFYSGPSNQARFMSPKLRAYTLDISSNNVTEVKSTLKEITTATNFISGGDYKYIYPQADGSTVVLSNTPYKSKFMRTPIIQVYNPDFSLKGQYRVGMPLAAEVADYGFFMKKDGSIGKHKDRGSLSGIREDPYFKRPEHQVSGRKWRYNNINGEYRFNTIEGQGITAIRHKNDLDVLTNAVTFFKGHTAFEFIREGNILYMMTPYAIVKLDMNHVVDAVPYKGPTSYNSSGKVFSRSFYQK